MKNKRETKPTAYFTEGEVSRQKAEFLQITPQSFPYSIGFKLKFYFG